MKVKELYFLDGPDEEYPFTFFGKTYYGEKHAGCGILFSNENRDGIEPNDKLFNAFFKKYPQYANPG